MDCQDWIKMIVEWFVEWYLKVLRECAKLTHVCDCEHCDLK